MTFTPRRAAVVGRPIEHSLSPVLHRAAYAALGLDITYDSLDAGRADLGALLSSLGPDWLGLSVTMPLKREALLLAATADPVAHRVGAANTLVPTPAGWRALTTDVPGLVEVLRPHVNEAVRQHSVVILGAGATARAALVALDLLGGVDAPVVVAARDSGRVPRAADLGLPYDIRPVAFGDPHVGAHLAGAGLVINATPPGAADPVVAALPSVVSGAYVDVVYDPWPTTLAAAWRARGGLTVGGLELLVAQAALQVEAMTGRPAPLAAMRAAIGLPVTPGPARPGAPVEDGNGKGPVRP